VLGAPGRTEVLRQAVEAVSVDGNVEVLEHPLDDASGYAVLVSEEGLHEDYVESHAHLCDHPPDPIVAMGCDGDPYPQAIGLYQLRAVFGPPDAP